MKKINVIYDEKGHLSTDYDGEELYIAQQEDKAVILSVTFPANLVGTVNAYLEWNGGGDIIESFGSVNINSHAVELALSSDHLKYHFLNVGFEVVTATKQVRFEPVTLEVDRFVNPTGSGASSAYTVTVKIGSVTELEADEEAFVTNSGTDKHLVLNFGIPKGAQGPQGEQGPKGDPGESAVSAMNARDEYNANADPAYVKGDYIIHTDGNTYVCKADNPTNEPPTDGAADDPFWQIIALRGVQGPQGEQGIQGPEGKQGPQGLPGKDGADSSIKRLSVDVNDGTIFPEFSQFDTVFSEGMYYIDYHDLYTYEGHCFMMVESNSDECWVRQTIVCYQWNLCNRAPVITRLYDYYETMVFEDGAWSEWQAVAASKEEFDNTVGDIETALDSIIAMQNELIGGDA